MPDERHLSKPRPRKPALPVLYVRVPRTDKDAFRAAAAAAGLELATWVRRKLRAATGLPEVESDGGA